MFWEVTTESPAATQQLGERFGSLLVRGDVVSLDGPLGTGKTRFVQGIAVALGLSRETVTSPTFTLLHEYPSSLPLVHADAYRLRDSDEFLDLGVSELWEEGVVVVEWGSRVRDALPRRTMTIVGSVAKETTRRFAVTCPDTLRDRQSDFERVLRPLVKNGEPSATATGPAAEAAAGGDDEQPPRD